MKSFLLMVQFFTRIPIPMEIPVTQKTFQKGIKFFPVVGAIIGGIVAGTHELVRSHVNPLSAVVLAVVIEVFLTGGLHLDGLADSFDGLYSARGKDRILEIMKDSRVGTYGVLSLVLLLFLKISFLENFEGPLRTKILFSLPVVSRCGVVFLARWFPYARKTGMGMWIIGNVSRVQMAGAVVLTALFLILICPIPEIFVVWSGAIAFAYLYGVHVKKYIGGITGDSLGAYIEMVEVVQLIFWMGLFSKILI